MKTLKNSSKGFTLIEILIVIGIIAILAAIVIVAINPAKQFAQARNTQRESNINTILNAVGQRIADNKGVFAGQFTIDSVTYTCPTLTAGTVYTILDDAAQSSTEIDLDCLYPTYIPAQIPVDPVGGTWTDKDTYDTKYTIEVNDTGRVTICAPNAIAEGSLPTITDLCVTR